MQLRRAVRRAGVMGIPAAPMKIDSLSPFQVPRKSGNAVSASAGRAMSPMRVKESNPIYA